MAVILPVDEMFSGLLPEMVVRNGLPPHGQFARALSRALNHLVARQGAIIPGMEVVPSSARNTASELALWRTRYRAGPNGTTLRCTVQCLPTTTTTGIPTWYLVVDGTPKTIVTHNNRVPSGGTDLSDIFLMSQDIAVTAGAMHTVELWTKDSCRIVGWTLREVPRDDLTVGTDTVVDYSTMTPLSGIYDNAMQGLIATSALAIFEKLRGVHLSWNADDPASPFVPGSTTPTNIWDASTARTANTAGPDCPTRYRDNYMDQFAATPVIPTYCWCYAELDAASGANIKVRFVGTNGAADITVDGSPGIYSTTSFTLAPQAGGDKVDVQAFRGTTGTGKVFAVGMFPLIGA